MRSGLTVIGIPSFIMTLAMMQIAAGISALLVRGQIAYKVPDVDRNARIVARSAASPGS